MPRRLSEEDNEMRFQDNLSGSLIVLFYRMPTPSERINYTNESFQRKGKNIVNRSVQTRIKFGLEILKGFREGDFEIRGKDGKWVPISSDPGSEHYYPAWKEHVKKYSSDLIEHLAIRVFDIPVQTPDDEIDEPEPEEPDEDSEPDGDQEASEDLDRD